MPGLVERTVVPVGIPDPLTIRPGLRASTTPPAAAVITGEPSVVNQLPLCTNTVVKADACLVNVIGLLATK